MAKKKKNKKAEEVNLLKPVNIYELGTDKDPCFGKHYDLTTDECKRCGDSELCAIATSQKLNGVREKIEKENEFKDIGNTATEDKLTRYIQKRKNKEYDLKRIIKLASKKFGADKKKIKSIYKSLK